MGSRNFAMFSLISDFFQSLLGPKVGGTATLMPRSQYYGISGRVELKNNAGPQVYDAPYLSTPYNPSGPETQTEAELGVSGRAMYGCYTLNLPKPARLLR